MKLFYSTTSPYARLVRIALLEKGLSGFEGRLTDPWQDAPDLLEANPCARVPALVSNDGQALTESLLILMWLESRYPANSLLGGDPSAILSKAGIAMGGVDAAAAIIIGRKMTDASFDESPVGLRRRRSVVNALLRLEAEPPAIDDDAPPSLAVIASIVLVDYVRFRFASAAWLPKIPHLDALSSRLRSRRSFEQTLPRDMPTT
jgi:glutathione S-transferase